MTINNISRVRSLSLPLFAAKADLLLLWSISGWNQYVLTNQHFFPFCYLFCIPPGNWHVLPAVRRHWRRRGRGVDPVNPFFSVNFIPSDPMSGGIDWQNRPPPPRRRQCRRMAGRTCQFPGGIQELMLHKLLQSDKYWDKWTKIDTHHRWGSTRQTRPRVYMQVLMGLLLTHMIQYLYSST